MKAIAHVGWFIGGLALWINSASAGPVPGAIFTTLSDGSAVNANIYSNKLAVYLDGGPGPNAPAHAAGLPEGDYFFQVTDPSGQKLLSYDPVASRKVHVNAFGVIDYAYPAPTITEVKGGADKGLWGTHASGVDIDHAELGAITVQLMPYKDTPNKGGVYKVWMTPVSQFVGNQNIADNGYSAGYFHGFIPAWSKTDNFKARNSKGGDNPPPSGSYQQFLYVLKFEDLNANGVWDDTEPALNWPVTASDPLGVVNAYWTPTALTYVDVWFENQTWSTTVTEELGDHWLQTALAVGTSATDLVAQAVSPSASVTFPVKNAVEERWVIFGNVPLGSIAVTKFYDRNGNGIQDTDEPLIADWTFHLDGTAVNGTPVHLIELTDANGVATFADLLPGTYQVTEVMPDASWIVTTAPSVDITLAAGGLETTSFGNAMISTNNADFGTKGYWHNKNGLSETAQSDLDYLNSLLPWLSPSTYFDAGDEPLDGFFADGTPVAAVNGSVGDQIAPAGSALAEQSQFLVDANANGDPREQLAQQLDAFIMNSLHRLPFGSAIWVEGAGWVTTTDMIADSILIWATGTEAEQHEMESLLDAFNNSDGVLHIIWSP